MPAGKIKEVQESYEQTVAEAVKDTVFVAGAMYESGANGINIDTVGDAGDADFLAALLASEQLKAR
jgi:dimethylamine---corrinoid protein Co-methyltransferase